jgi:signal transduction histidine kinase
VKRLFGRKVDDPDVESDDMAPEPVAPPAVPPVEETDQSFHELRTGFTAAVSHELRTPLARILVLLDSADLPGADVHRLIEHARAEVEHAGALIDEILFLSELESGKEVVALGRTNALPVVEDVVRTLDDTAARAGVELRADGDPDVDLPLRPRMLRMVAENLTENAIRYAGHGATFTLSAHREGDTVVLAGADDGIGVADADLPRLFERFFRADRARASRGTGLGLAIVKHVVTAAGGSVEASSARGSGLTIRCVFPVA